MDRIQFVPPASQYSEDISCLGFFKCLPYYALLSLGIALWRRRNTSFLIINMPDTGIPGHPIDYGLLYISVGTGWSFEMKFPAGRAEPGVFFWVILVVGEAVGG